MLKLLKFCQNYNKSIVKFNRRILKRFRQATLTSTLHKVQSNELENLSAPSHLKHPASRNLQSSNSLPPSHPEHLASRNLNTSTPLHEVQSNELENFSVLSCPELRDLNFSASLRSFNASTFPILPPCFNNMYGYDFPARHLAICESKCSSIC
ncbi:hypothetical protein RirG_052110 [Rhizophagus irregularis DAOM 197198w]|uniref:Uncharacterized protein n=1 Tax=Rhizophagus irregularis (strain DAOM 197198w) TaxID=1432141 RepID=A0A015N5A5_RHIIW|nr:hypothetical protein RirG_052110 [Rhizophagus irregularis DAOM 197198w]